MLPCPRSILLSAVALAVLAACGPGGGRSASPDAPESPAGRIQAEHRAWTDQFSAFRARAASAIADGVLLRNHPGWPDMEKIVRARLSVRRFEGEAAARDKTARALTEWGGRWQAPGDTILSAYDGLVAQSQRLETERLRLLEWRYELWKRGSDGIRREVTAAGSGMEIQMLSRLLGRWNTLRDEEVASVERYGVDPIGLYQRRAGEKPGDAAGGGR